MDAKPNNAVLAITDSKFLWGPSNHGNILNRLFLLLGTGDSEDTRDAEDAENSLSHLLANLRTDT